MITGVKKLEVVSSSVAYEFAQGSKGFLIACNRRNVLERVMKPDLGEGAEVCGGELGSENLRTRNSADGTSLERDIHVNS